MTSQARMAILQGLRMQIEALIVEEDAAMHGAQPAPEPGSCPQCGAAPDTLQDTSTMDGTKRSRCPACGAEWER